MTTDSNDIVFTTEDTAEQGRKSQLSLGQVASLKLNTKKPFGQNSVEVTKTSGGKRTVLGTEILSAFSQIDTVTKARVGDELHLVNLANFRPIISDNGELSLTNFGSSKNKIVPLNKRGNTMSEEEFYQALG